MINESNGAWNAVSSTGALGVMQLTAGNYLKANINPFNTQQAILHGASMLNIYIKKYGNNAEGINRSLVAYNQGEPVVDHVIKKYGNEWRRHVPKEGGDYIDSINYILNGNAKIPGYFGTTR